ncbi:MAG: alpha/beta hydrolase [Armatimonadetes bacterium]|nr:alpha/beta hydrolase [Armatimonadota bacterium]
MHFPLNIKVHYPEGKGRIILRAESDWTADVRPTRVEGVVTVFEIKARAPFLYFKPCLVTDESFHWSCGTNYLAYIGEPESLNIYPRFYSEKAGGTITEVEDYTCFETGRLHKTRTYLPSGYHENPLRSYPVLYMHDGNNLFFPREAFLGQDWQVDETMGMLDDLNIINKVIVVGVWPNDREDEYTRPGYEVYGRFIVRDLKPVIDKRLRTIPGPATTAVMGSSLGGVVSFYMAWQWPEVFGLAACMSSTFGWKDDLMRRVASEQRRPIRIYLDSGGPGDNYEVTRAMRDMLLLRGYKLGSELLCFAFAQDRHNEKYWAMRSHIPFQFFFSKLPHGLQQQH